MRPRRRSRGEPHPHFALATRTQPRGRDVARHPSHAEARRQSRAPFARSAGRPRETLPRDHHAGRKHGAEPARSESWTSGQATAAPHTEEPRVGSHMTRKSSHPGAGQLTHPPRRPSPRRPAAPQHRQGRHQTPKEAEPRDEHTGTAPPGERAVGRSSDQPARDLGPAAETIRAKTCLARWGKW